ncbi:hypothetical protein Tter_1785 [Thermobaculum terrenum ATCC BAA-798]|uniref:Uncharacterized protein n=1 Tax=Thermobaculum terrenum (strain ATCC BAA-798 / CCMEE 7001 / YNP1) TaxID=525904 RepID=D1CD26_THET1|nr:hypothetical protein Tter_1785 [Thermobaculum terrenum ATCC BAA-798]
MALHSKLPAALPHSPTAASPTARPQGYPTPTTLIPEFPIVKRPGNREFTITLDDSRPLPQVSRPCPAPPTCGPGFPSSCCRGSAGAGLLASGIGLRPCASSSQRQQRWSGARPHSATAPLQKSSGLSSHLSHPRHFSSMYGPVPRRTPHQVSDTPLWDPLLANSPGRAQSSGSLSVKRPPSDKFPTSRLLRDREIGN